jgi:hypothetical protein
MTWLYSKEVLEQMAIEVRSQADWAISNMQRQALNSPERAEWLKLARHLYGESIGLENLAVAAVKESSGNDLEWILDILCLRNLIA